MDSSLTFRERVAAARHTLAFAQTFTYYAAFVALGLTTASLGPTLLGLARQTGSELSAISFLFTARALGYLVGSFVGGRLYDRFPGHWTMAGGLVAIAALLAAVPLVPLLALLTAVLLVVGFMEGVVDVGGNTLIVWVHQEKVGPWMNGLHLFFAVGAFLSPLLVAQAILLTGSIAWSYWALALLLLPVALRLMPLGNPRPLLTHTDAGFAHPNYLVLALVLVFFGLYAGAEQAFGGWIFTYSVKTGLTDEATAAYVNAAYWGAFTVARVASIPIAARVRPRVIILADLVLALAGVGLLLAFAGSPLTLWLGTLLFGLGIASGFPTMLTFAGRHMTITGAITGWFFVGASLGGMILPWAIGQLVEPVGPVAVLAIIGGALGIGVVVFAGILRTTGRKG